MNYDSPELRELLAGEYALGTLAGAARRRFERLLVEDAHLRAELVNWETYFGAWASALPLRVPPARVWKQIERRIAVRESSREQRSFWGGTGFWQACTGLAAAALIAIVVLWQLAPSPASAPVEVAVVTSQAGQPVWVVSVQTSANTLTIKAKALAAPPAGKTYELWMLLGKNRKPVSLGVLPAHGEITRHLSPGQARALATTQTLAVSIEPPGGSPTGLPTGPVVYTAPLVRS